MPGQCFNSSCCIAGCGWVRCWVPPGAEDTLVLRARILGMLWSVMHGTTKPTPPLHSLSTRSDYLFMNLLIGPYFPPEVAANSSGAGSSGARRRLAAWVGEVVSLCDLGGGGLPAGLVAVEARGELERRVKTLLTKPQLALARRHPKGNRRLLVAPPEEEPANSATSDMPQLKVSRAAR